MPCLWPRPERGMMMAASAGSPRWIARPVGTSARVAGAKRDGIVDRGAQVESRGAVRRVGGHLGTDALVQDSSRPGFFLSWGTYESCLMGVTLPAWRVSRKHERVLDDAVGDARLRARARAGARPRRRRSSLRFLPCRSCAARGSRRSSGSSCARASPARSPRGSRSRRRSPRRRDRSGSRPRTRGCLRWASA